jgi:acetyl esterase/lipase
MMVILHGGGWFQIGPGQVQSERGLADIWRRRGWRTLNTDYNACVSSVSDVVGLYDHFRKLADGHAICALGESAGGHLALMLAAERPAVRCVIAYAAPVNLPAFPSERTAGTLPGQQPSSGPQYVYDLAVAAFGAPQLVKLSPALQAQHIRARVLLAVAADDVLIPWSQLTGFASRRPRRTRIIQVPPGPVHWVHGTTTPAGVQQVARAAFRLTAGLH